MSEERFDRIDRDLAEVKTDVAVLKADVAVLKTDVAELKTDVVELKAGFANLEARVDEFQVDIKRHMGVLHDQLRDDIKAITLLAPDLERKWKADDAVLHEAINRRLDPLEAAVKTRASTHEA